MESPPPPSRFPPRRGRRWKWKISGARKWKCPRLPGNNASKTMRRKFRKSKGPVAREGCIGGWVRASSIDSRRGISADYTRQSSKKKKKKKKGERNRDMENEFCNVEGSSRVRRRPLAVEETSSLYRFEQFESKNWLAWTSWIIWIGEELVGFDMNEHSVLFYRGEFIIGVEKLREERRSLWENRISLELLEREIERVCVKDW